MTRINAESQLFIALNPDAENDEDKNYTKICAATECVFNSTYNKTDKNYFCNGGDTTAVITGRTNNLTVSIDLDDTNEAHIYLLNLLRNQNWAVLNKQFIKIEYPLFSGETKPAYAFGESCIQFKNNIPSGAANELIKLQFDIFPQNKPWEIVPAETK